MPLSLRILPYSSARTYLLLPLRSILISLCVLALASAASCQNVDSASLHGAVRDGQGKAVGNAEVQLQFKDSSRTQTTRTDLQGNYSFNGLQPGVYSLRVLTENGNGEISSLFLSHNESKTADVTLNLEHGAASSPAEAPKFFDQPHFTVSGVTDTTSLGGHGSDTIVRTRDALAKETASLGKPSPSLSVNESSLRKSAEELRSRLAQHETAELHHQLAEIAEQLGDSLEAVSQYQRAAAMDASEGYLFDWGSELLLHHAPEPAIEVFTNGNRHFPRSSRMLIGLGAAWFTRGNVDEATRRVCEAADLNPNDSTPYLFLGRMLQAGSAASPEVVERLHRFVTLQPKNAEANYYGAVALAKLHKPAAEIEPLLTKAVSLEPKFALAHLQLGILHSQQAHDAAAISDYQHAIQSDPQLEEAHYRLAQAYRLAGQPDKVQDELRIYKQLSKESAQRSERERHEIRQFVYTLRDRSSPNQNP